MSDVLLVRVGTRQVALAVEPLVEVIELTTAFPVPSATPALRGVMPVRERLVPVLHLGAALEGEACPEERGEMVVIATTDRRTIGLEVDDASEVAPVETAPLPDDVQVPGAVGVVHRDGVFIPVIDVGLLAAQLIDIGMAS